MLVQERGWLKLLLSTIIVQANFYLFDVCDVSMIRRRSLLVVRMFQALGLSGVILALIFYLVPQMLLGRNVVFVHLLLTLTTMTCWCVFATHLLGTTRFAERVLVIGTGRNAIELAREVLAHRDEGFHLVGFVGNEPRLLGQSLINPRVIGLISDLEEVVRTSHIDRLVVALGDERGRLPLGPLLELKLRDGVAIEEAPSFYEHLTGKISTSQLRPSQLIFSDSSRWTRFYRRWRPVADVVLAFATVTFTLPLALLTAIAIKFDSPGPVFYTQDRVGIANKMFKIIKFRSMRTDAEAEGPKWADLKDGRITRVGRIIRKLRIDELPQLLNIIRGEMGFIGPRPERPVFVEQLQSQIPYYSQRHWIRPGLTGWAQVRYAYGASVEDAIEKLQYDLYYIKNQSFMLDTIILLETVRIVLFGRLAR